MTCERRTKLDNMKKRDDRIYKEIREKEEKEKAKELERIEKEQQVEAGVKYNVKARKKVTPPPLATGDDAPVASRLRKR